MTAYIIRRVLYAIPILLGINILVFMLFFFVNSPDNMAKQHIGEKRITPDRIEEFKREHNLDLPHFYNTGWRRFASVSATEKSNSKTLALPGSGEYRITVEAPMNADEAIAAGRRKITLTCSEQGLLELPSDFFEGTLELAAIPRPSSGIVIPEDEQARTWAFKVKPTDDEVNLDVKFDLNTRGLYHRVALDYREHIPFFERFTRTLFWQHSFRMLFFQYGNSMRNQPIGREVLKRMVPSLMITVPAFIVGLILTIAFALMLAFLRGTYIDYWGVVMCVLLMSISQLFYILGGQLVLSRWLKLFPISGYGYGLSSWKFIAMPIVIAVIGGLGGRVRFYRTIFLEEINKDYVRTARAKGLAERTVLFVHVLKNAMIPILTNVVVALPGLISAGLVMESFFAIPGLGGFTLQGIMAQDFIIVQAMVSLGSFLFVVALLMTDISYTLVDPRVRLE